MPVFHYLWATSIINLYWDFNCTELNKRKRGWQTNCNRTSARVPARTLITPRFWQVLENRLATHRLRIQAHQIEELRWNVSPDRQTKALCRLICDRVVVSPGPVR